MLHGTDVLAQYNAGGHVREWTISVPGFDHERYIPRGVSAALQELLGEQYAVSNRGSRLEINSALFVADGDEFAELITTAVQEAVVAGGVYETAPRVTLRLYPYVAPPTPTRACPRGCGQVLSFRELLEHVRSAHG